MRPPEIDRDTYVHALIRRRSPACALYRLSDAAWRSRCDSAREPDSDVVALAQRRCRPLRPSFFDFRMRRRHSLRHGAAHAAQGSAGPASTRLLAARSTSARVMVPLGPVADR
jgi:hypothetical protein